MPLRTRSRSSTIGATTDIVGRDPHADPALHAGVAAAVERPQRQRSRDDPGADLRLAVGDAAVPHAAGAGAALPEVPAADRHRAAAGAAGARRDHLHGGQRRRRRRRCRCAPRTQVSADGGRRAADRLRDRARADGGRVPRCVRSRPTTARSTDDGRRKTRRRGDAADSARSARRRARTARSSWASVSPGHANEPAIAADLDRPRHLRGRAAGRTPARAGQMRRGRLADCPSAQAPVGRIRRHRVVAARRAQRRDARVHTQRPRRRPHPGPRRAVAAARAISARTTPIDPVTRQPRSELFWIRARLVRDAVRAAAAPPADSHQHGGGAPGADRHATRFSAARAARANQAWQLREHAGAQGDSLHDRDQRGAHGRAGREWKVVDDLFGSGPSDEHVAVNWSSGEVRAGNGEHGQVPVANAANPDTNVDRRRVPLSAAASAATSAAGAIATLLTSIDGIDGAATTNLFDAAGGSDEEADRATRRSARGRCCARASGRSRPTTSRLLAKQAGNVRRAKACRSRIPRFPGVQVPGAITVIIVPDSKVPNPAAVRRPAADRVRVPRRAPAADDRAVRRRPAATCPVSVDATVVVTDDADPGRP